MKKITSAIIIAVLTILLLTLNIGCSALTGPEKKPRAEKTKSGSAEKVQVDHETAEQIKQIAQKVKGVDEVTAVVVNKDVSVALKVSGFDRLRLKQIKKEVQDKIMTTVGKDNEIHVTTDKKLFSEIQKLEQQIKTSDGDKAFDKKLTDIKNKVSKINEDMQG